MKYIGGIIFFLLLLTNTGAFANDNSITLPKPDTKGGKPLMQVLEQRKTERAVSTKELSINQISNLLWAACGTNRKDGRRTAPSARNWQEIELYVAMAKGTYRYEPGGHKLILISKEDIRQIAYKQDFPQKAPLTIIYVANYDKQTGLDDKNLKTRYAAVDTGFIGQNIYLYCASEGLATTFIGMIESKKIAAKLKLRNNHEVLFGQCVGYPETKSK